MSDYYILTDDKLVVPARDVMEWSAFFENFDKRRVRQDRVGGLLVSTVFLGLNYRAGDEGAPLVFETMVLDKNHHDVHCERASTWEEAIEKHVWAMDVAKRQLEGAK